MVAGRRFESPPNTREQVRESEFRKTREQRSVGNPIVGRVPTLDERNGVFATAVHDPLTGQEFPRVGANWQIPLERMSPISRKILELWPTPNNNDVLARNFRFEVVIFAL